MPRQPPERCFAPSEAPDSEELRDWLALANAPRVGPRTFARLCDCFATPSAARRASSDQLGQLGLKPETIRALRQPDWPFIERVLRWAEQPGARIITMADPLYPPALAEIPGAPPILYARGDPLLLSEPQIAVVGSRNPTPGGREVTETFTRRLAGHGLVITSGLAIGVDGAAHEAALEHGRTIAVLGTGPDLVYPAVHRDLAHRIAEHGVMVSEFPPGQGPLARNFPRRNRIISGLSLGVLVTEAALKSGSLITARTALEQGREVFAVPGSIRNPLARGCHALIRDGAKLVESTDEILSELAPQLRALIASNTPTAQGARDEISSEMDAAQRELLDAMGYDPVAVDELTERTGLAVERISSMLLLMELGGHVSSLAGGRYCRSRDTS